MAFNIPNTPEELFRQGSRQFAQFNKWLPGILFILILLFIVLTSFYSVDQNEVGVVRRFGKYSRTTPPGLHWKLPFGIEQLDKVKVTKVFKEEFGFRTLEPGVRTKYSTQSFDDESQMLTGDLNVISISWVVQFKIKDPVKLLFHIRNPRETVRDLSEAVMRQVIGDSSVSEALTTRKNEIRLEAKDQLQKILDSYESGIAIHQLELQDVTPPDPVKASFNEVNEAEQERDRVINEAWEAYNKVIPKAEGEAQKTIRVAEGYALARVKKAEGDAAKFLATWNAYKEAKDVTRRRLYLETLQNVLPAAGKIYVIDPETKNILPFLNLSEGTKAQ